MTSKEKKNLIIKEVVKSCFKEAGYEGGGQTYYSEQENCILGINIQTSQMLVITSDSLKAMEMNRDMLEFMPEEIRANEDLYKQVKVFSRWSREDKWQFILSSLPKE